MIEQAAQQLAAARREGARLNDLPPRLRPRTLEEAYKIQTAASRLLGPVGGWKVGAEPDGSIRVAPIPAFCISDQRLAPPVAAPSRLEIEFAVLIGTDLPDGPYRPEAMAGAIAAAHVAAELLEHRFIDRGAVDELSFLADGNGNGRVIVGEALPGWRHLDLSALNVRLGALAGPPGASTGAVMVLLAALASHAARHAGGLKAGQIVITGARAGPLTFDAGRAEGSINGSSVKIEVV